MNETVTRPLSCAKQSEFKSTRTKVDMHGNFFIKQRVDRFEGILNSFRNLKFKGSMEMAITWCFVISESLNNAHIIHMKEKYFNA